MTDKNEKPAKPEKKRHGRATKVLKPGDEPGKNAGVAAPPSLSMVDEARSIRGRTLIPLPPAPPSEKAVSASALESGELQRLSFTGDPEDVRAFVKVLGEKFPESADEIARSFGVISDIAEGREVASLQDDHWSDIESGGNEKPGVPTEPPPPPDGLRAFKDDRLANGNVKLSAELRKAVVPADAPIVVIITSVGMLRVPIAGNVRIGRALDNDVVIEDNPFVSKYHIEFENVAGRVMIRDLGSRNGTVVNREQLTGLRELRDTDRIFLGDMDNGAKIFFSDLRPIAKNGNDLPADTKEPEKGKDMTEIVKAPPPAREQALALPEPAPTTTPEPENAPEPAPEPAPEQAPEPEPLPPPKEPEPNPAPADSKAAVTVDIAAVSPDELKAKSAGAETKELPPAEKKDDEKKEPPPLPPTSGNAVGQSVVFRVAAIALVAIIAVVLAIALIGWSHKRPVEAVPATVALSDSSAAPGKVIDDTVKPAAVENSVEVVIPEPPNPLDEEAPPLLAPVGYRPVDPNSPIADFVTGARTPSSVADCLPPGKTVQELDAIRCIGRLRTYKLRNDGVFQLSKWVLATEGAFSN